MHIDPSDGMLITEFPVRSRNTLRRAPPDPIMLKTISRKVIRHLLKIGLELEPTRGELRSSFSATTPARPLSTQKIDLVESTFRYVT